MRYSLLLFALWLLAVLIGIMLCSACSTTPTLYRIDGTIVRMQNDLWYANSELMTGTVYQLSPEGDTLFLQEVREGKPHGITRSWYPRSSNGTVQLQEVRFFVQGKREQTHYGYWENGNKKFEYTYTNDVYEGTQKEWYNNGVLYRIAHYHEGHEYGLQQAFTNDGALSVNYEARNGRNYGTIGKKRCRTIWAHGTPRSWLDSASTDQMPRGRGGM